MQPAKAFDLARYCSSPKYSKAATPSHSLLEPLPSSQYNQKFVLVNQSCDKTLEYEPQVHI